MSTRLARGVCLGVCLALSACASKTYDGLPGEASSASRVGTANMRLGAGYMRDGQYRKALQAFERAVEADPQNPGPYNMLGVLHHRLREFERAETYFRKALRMELGAPSVLNNLGRLLCELERRDEAEQVFLRAATNPLYEKREVALTNAGMCVQVDGRLEQAEEYYRRALEFYPSYPPALLRMAEASHEQGEHLAARAFLQRYAVVSPHTPKTLLLGVKIEKSLGDRDRAASLGMMLRGHFPDSREAQEYGRSSPSP